MSAFLRTTRAIARMYLSSRFGRCGHCVAQPARMRTSLLATVLVLGVASVAGAAPIGTDSSLITYHIGGVINFSFFDHGPVGADPLASAIPGGSAFTIDATVDTSDPGFVTSGGTHLYADALVGLVFNLGGLTYTMTSHDTNPFFGMSYTPTSINSGLSSAVFSGPAIIDALPGGEFLFNADALTQSGNLYVGFFGPIASVQNGMGQGRVFGQITSVDVPEPSTLLLMGGALAITGLGSRLRKRFTRR